jgi:hypothetical protein
MGELMSVIEAQREAVAVLNPFAVLRDPTVSSYREQLVEYAFVSELLQDGWLRRRQPIDVLRSDVDAAGYDLVLECQGITRHVQLKSTVLGGTRRTQNIHTRLGSCPSGCVVWVVLEPGEAGRIRLAYLVFGSTAGLPLTSLSSFPVAKHTKGDSTGHKSDRPAIREVPKSAFVALPDMAALTDWLFGSAGPQAATEK